MRAVSVVEVARTSLWDALAAVVGEEAFAESLSPTQRVVTRAFEESLEALARGGIRVLVRYARRSEAEVEQSRADLSAAIERLPTRARTVLWRAAAHARDGVVLGSHVWDPLEEADCVRALHGAGLVRALPDEGEPFCGRYLLHEDLPPPPTPAFAFEEAAMGLTDDLSEPGPSPVDLLHDVAALAAAIGAIEPKRTLKGALDKNSVAKLGARLATEFHGALDARFTRALTALELLGAVQTDPILRTLHVEPGLEPLLAGTTAEALDHLVHRLVDPDLQPVLPAVRAAIATAGEGAIDELIFLELVAEQQRDIVFAPWRRDGRWVYPEPAGDRLPWTEEAFEHLEGRLIGETLGVLRRLGLIRRAPGVFAPTVEGRLWATGDDPPAPPVWLGSDLEVLVPPHAITPWERYQLERFGRCRARDVVDRYVLEREGLERWLATHPLADALDLLARRSPAVPASVRETLEEWHRAATEVVLTRGVLLPAE